MGREPDIERVIEQFSKLVSIDSVSLGERKMADTLKAELEGLGFTVTEDDAGAHYGSDTGNLYGILKGNNAEKKPVLLSAHMDTVVPGIGKRAVIDREKGVITSAGDTVLGADDVAGIVQILEAIRMAKDDPAGHGDIEVLFTISEESYCRGASVFDFSKVESDVAYVIDMSGSVGNGANAAPSIISFDFEILGRPAHAGFDPSAGINAIALAAEIIAGTEQGLIADGLTLNIGTITGGSASNIVPDRCKCSGEVRGNDHEAALKALSGLHDRAKAVCRDAGAECIFNSRVMIKAYEIPPDEEVCATFVKACRNLGFKGTLVSTRGGSDNNVFAEHGIRGIVVGCGMRNTHSVTEYIEISDFERGSRLIAEILSLR